MIRQHDFNSRWFGAPVALITDAAFFKLPTAEREALLRPFAFAEFRATLPPEPGLAEAAGFWLADVQVPFRIGLAKVADVPSLTAQPGAQPKDLARFSHERLGLLPGVDAARVDARYQLWAGTLASSSPATALTLSADGRTQGYFLSERDPDGSLRLTLAALHKDATISGHLVYQKALHVYAAQGFRVGHAAFSVTNTAVLNIYSRLGAHFLAPEGRWLRKNGDTLI